MFISHFMYNTKNSCSSQSWADKNVTQMNERRKPECKRGMQFRIHSSLTTFLHSAFGRHLLFLFSAGLFHWFCVCCQIGLCRVSCGCFLFRWAVWIRPEKKIKELNVPILVYGSHDLAKFLERRCHQRHKLITHVKIEGKAGDLYLIEFGDLFSSWFSWSADFGFSSESEPSFFSPSDSPLTGFESEDSTADVRYMIQAVRAFQI